jgi:hypothetical protein
LARSTDHRAALLPPGRQWRASSVKTANPKNPPCSAFASASLKKSFSSNRAADSRLPRRESRKSGPKMTTNESEMEHEARQKTGLVSGQKSGTIKWNGRGPINGRFVPLERCMERYRKTGHKALNFKSNHWNENRNDGPRRPSSFRSTPFTRGVRGDFSEREASNG